MTGSGSEGLRRLDRVLSDDFLADLGSLPLADVRARRDEAEQEEADLSYLRRLVQGRMDILQAELARRSGGEGGSLIADLPRILGDKAARSAPRGMGRHITAEPSRADEHRRYVEALVADVDLSDVSARSDDELTAALSKYREAEQDVSGKRKRVHEIIDECTTEITRRYRDGEADIADLLTSGPLAPPST